MNTNGEESSGAQAESTSSSVVMPAVPGYSAMYCNMDRPGPQMQHGSVCGSSPRGLPETSDGPSGSSVLRVCSHNQEVGETEDGAGNLMH